MPSTDALPPAQLLSSLLKHSKSIVIGLTVKLDVCEFNAAAEKMFKCKRQDALGEKIAVLCKSARLLLPLPKSKYQLLLSKEKIHYILFIIDSKIDRSFIAWTALRLIEKNNKTKGFLLIGEKIDQSEADQDLLQAKKQAESANRAKSNFLATISHELRIPMNSILGMAQILDEKIILDEQREYINVIISASKNLLILINDILDFSKLKAGKLNVVLKPLAFSALVDEVVFCMQPLLKDKNIKLLVEFDSNIPINLEGDPLRLRQVLINLISNAIKFTEKGNIKVKVVCETKTAKIARICITIEDTGIGIPKAKLINVFDWFTQVQANSDHHIEGAGLGLAICKELVAAMGGTIGVKSKLRKGSEFYFRIPFPIAEKNKNAASNHHLAYKVKSTLSTAKNYRLLLVEDNPLNQRVTKIMLEELGFKLDIAVDGEQAIKFFKKRHYDLIFMDIDLPDMDGLHVTRKIRHLKNANKHVPVVAMTAHVLEESLPNYKQSGVDDIVTKPIMQDALFKIIEKYLGEN